MPSSSKRSTRSGSSARAAADDFAQPAAQPSAHLRKDGLAQVDADLPRQLGRRDAAGEQFLLPLFAHLVANLLIDGRNEERHQNHTGRAEDVHIAHDVFQAVVDADRRPEADRREHPAAGLIGVVQRQHGEQDVPAAEIDHIRGRPDAFEQVVVRKHNALAGAGRAGGEDDRAHRIHVHMGGGVRVVAVLIHFPPSSAIRR